MKHLLVLGLALATTACRSGCDVTVDEMCVVPAPAPCSPCGTPGSRLVPARSLGGYRVATSSWNPFTGAEANHKIMMDAAATATMLAGGATPLGAAQLGGQALQAFTAAFQQRSTAVASQEASLLAQQKALLDLGQQLTGGVGSAAAQLSQGALGLSSAASAYLAKRPLLALGLPLLVAPPASAGPTTTAQAPAPSATRAQPTLLANAAPANVAPAAAPSAPGLPPPVVRRAGAVEPSRPAVLVARAR